MKVQHSKVVASPQIDLRDITPLMPLHLADLGVDVHGLQPSQLSEKQTARLGELLKLNLSSIKGYLLREDFSGSGNTSKCQPLESFSTTE